MKHLFLLALFMLGGMFAFTASAQTDTIYHKQQLPTGPPAAPGSNAPPLPPLPPSVAAQDQEEEDEELEIKQPFNLKGKLLVGGSGGLSFSSSPVFGTTTFISVSPMLGYRVSEKLTVGPGFTYEFVSTEIGNFNNYGGRAFTQFSVFNNVFNDFDELMIHAEYEVMNVESVRIFSNMTYETYRNTIGSTLVGLGYRQAFSEKFFGDIYLLYNASEGPESPYGPLVFRFALIWKL